MNATSILFSVFYKKHIETNIKFKNIIIIMYGVLVYKCCINQNTATICKPDWITVTINSPRCAVMQHFLLTRVHFMSLL